VRTARVTIAYQTILSLVDRLIVGRNSKKYLEVIGVGYVREKMIHADK
jgi:hypothetical protein